MEGAGDAKFLSMFLDRPSTSDVAYHLLVDGCKYNRTVEAPQALDSSREKQAAVEFGSCPNPVFVTDAASPDFPRRHATRR